MSLARALAALLLASAPASCRDSPPAAPKPVLHLMTPLPLLFAEKFAIESEKPAVTALLDQHYRLQPVDLPSQLPAGATLLAVQPRALPAEELVALDEWVRRGGRLVLLADPLLEWPSERPLGDRLRPPPMFADTGLLGHWGLRLDSPDSRGPVASARPAGATLLSPGRLVRTGGECSVGPGGHQADCRLGRGRAIVVADADWLNVAAGDPNLAALEALLDSARD
jgi:hypothetical protein